MDVVTLKKLAPNYVLHEHFTTHLHTHTLRWYFRYFLFHESSHSLSFSTHDESIWSKSQQAPKSGSLAGSYLFSELVRGSQPSKASSSPYQHLPAAGRTAGWVENVECFDLKNNWSHMLRVRPINKSKIVFFPDARLSSFLLPKTKYRWKPKNEIKIKIRRVVARCVF